MQDQHSPAVLELRPSPRYMLRTDTRYNRGAEVHGLTKAELRSKVLAWFKEDEYALTLYIEIEPAHG